MWGKFEDLKIQTTTLSETNCFGDTGVGASGDGRSSKTVSPGSSGASMLRRAGILGCCFLLAVSLLGVDDARARELELFSINFVPQLRHVQDPSDRTNKPSRYYMGIFSDETFTFNGVTYTVNRVAQGGYQVVINITPKFPPDGQDRSKFDLEVGTARSDGSSYIKEATFNFADATVSDEDNAWEGGAGWGGGKKCPVVHNQSGY